MKPFLLILLMPALLQAQSRYFAGALGGIATLSADAETSIGPDAVAFSTYRPSNGAVLNVFGGTHLTDFLSLQGNYIWNRNEITVTTSTAAADVYEEKRKSSQHAGMLDVLLYFRNRQSWARPYLSVGSGVVRFQSEHREVVHLRGSPPRLPSRFAANELSLRVAVGIDVTIRRQFAVRYSFSETVGDNPISNRLTPRGERNLANFQNLFGIVKYF